MTTKLLCTFTGTGTTPATGINLTSLNQGMFGVSITGVGTVALEMLPAGTSTWIAVSTSSTGTPNSFAVAAATPVGGVNGYNDDALTQYRFNVTAYTSTITAIITQGGQVTL